MTILTTGYVRWCDKLKTLNLICHNTYCHEIFQIGDLLREGPTPYSLNHVVLRFCFSPMRFVVVERHCLSRYRRLVSVWWKQKAFGFSFILPILPQTFPEYWEIRNKKNILLTIKQLMQFFWSILFLNKSQLSGISQKPVDKCSQLFISILKETLSGLQKPVKNDMTISEQMAHAAIFYFGQVFIYCRCSH